MKKPLSFAVIFLMVLIVPLTSFGQNLKDLKKKQETIKGNTTSAQKSLADTQKLKTTTFEEINIIDDEMEKVTNELEFIASELEKTNVLLAKTGEELRNAEAEHEKQNEQLKKRIKYMYINGRVGFLDVIFKAQNFVDFITRFDKINLIIKRDNEIIEKIKELETEITDKCEATERQKKEVELLLSTQESKKHSLEESIKQKEQVIIKLNEDEKKYEQMLNESIQADKDIKAMIQKAEAEEAKKAAANQIPVNFNGKLGWPVPNSSKITDTYRNRINPVTKKYELHTGLDISASTGTNIVSAEAGTVTMAAWFGGYGNCVMINHGGGIVTLYGHNSKLVVKVGDTVKRGTVIAKAGSTGISSGPHCHFEVRVNGTAVDPMKYLK